MAQIFFVGGTGHIGGAVLDHLLKEQTQAKVKVLVRDEAKAGRLVKAYPQVECVIGDTGMLELLEKCSQEADIVINTSPDITHDAGIKAILSGLKSRKGPKPHYIHTSGASLLWDEPTGSDQGRWWNDIIDIREIMAFKGEAHTHAVTDKIVRDAAPDVNVAIISPGFVGGLSPSTEHPTPITTPALFLTARALRSGWQIAEGQNIHTWIHVDDLARMYMVLVEKAIEGPSEAFPEPFDIWGPEAYYFGTSEEMTFAEFMQELVPVFQDYGVIPHDQHAIRSVSVVEAARLSMGGTDYDPDATPPPPDTWAMHIAIMYGVNMRVKSVKMDKLGWIRKKESVLDTLRDVVADFLRQERLSLGYPK